MNKADLSKFVPNENFVIEDPNSSYMGDRAKEAEMGIEQANHLADSLFHSAVVLNSVSSLLIDAAVFDKPVVTVCFDGWEKNVPITRSVLTEQANEWLQVLLDKGLSPKAHTAEEMIRLIRDYLDHGEKDRDKRAHFVEEHCYKLDGKASERIEEAVLS
jgi:CDP-glycerol glycerophosphotransferase (TagB/SpsB family)